ncbi:MAG: hypothetical protein JRI72_09430 [Deltaproteobacteria bacterium]|nr:hypothetical protein [Deltaproteobacteria bacterium]
MLSKENILSFFLAQDKLWQSETKHEAMRLLKSLYESSPEHRERLVDYVLIGPPLSRGKDSEDDKRYTEHKVFTMLEYLKDQGLELTGRGKEYLESIKLKYPEWKLGRDADIENSIYVGWHKNQFTIEEIYSKLPKEVALMLKDYKGTWERDRSEFCDTVGATCHMYPKWGLELFRHLSNILTELPEDTINHIVWGLRSTDEKEKVAWDLKQIHHLTNIFQEMVAKRPAAGFWTSLPGLLQNWQKTYKVGLDFFGNLLNRLASIFKSFDYEREKKDDPVEWIQRAANHPYGDLTELYLEYAHQGVTEKEKVEIDSKIIKFFEFTIDNYDYGTRYGLCVLGRRLSWFEAIVPDWTEKNLIPAFNWANNKEMALIAWSGYLWNRTLSRYLSKLFDDYFLDAAQHYKEFGKEEQKGLTIHVAALIWFKDIEMTNLKKFTSLIDREGRINILAMWQQHLARAEKPIAESFWNTTIIPYWDWCERQRYLALPDGNTERFRFWELIPYSYQVVTKAVKKAVNLAPSGLDHVYPFHKELLKTDFSVLYPEEFTCLLLAFIQADQNPRWHKDEWEKLWDSVKNSGAKRLGKLKDELARKRGIVN